MKHSPVTPLIELARDIAFEAHTGQTRRDRETPYIVHPMTVAGKLQQAGEGEEVIAAADERGLAMVVTGIRHFRH